MTFLPIVARELRVGSRRRGAWLARVVAAFVAVVVGTFVLLVSESNRQPAEVGKEMFATVAGFLFLYVLVAGALVTCDCLAEEKREGTLGLLFLTDLKGYDVVFGKLAATSLNTIYAILAVVPLMAIPILMGGVGTGEFWRVAIVAMNLLLFSLSVGIFASSVSRSEHRAMLLSFVIIAVLIIAPWLMSLRGWGSGQERTEWLALFSPGFSCFTAFDEVYRSNWSGSPSNVWSTARLLKDTTLMFWSCVALTLIYVWIFLFVACRVVPRSWQESGQRFAQIGIFARIRELLEGSAGVRAARRRRMLEINPYFWRAARNRSKHIFVWALLVGAAALWCSSGSRVADDFDVGRDIFVMVFVNATLKWWVASESSRHLSEDRASGSLELLLSTPLRESEILHGQGRALLHQFFWPVAVVLAADFVFLLAALRHTSGDERAGLLMVYLIIAGFLAFDLVALSSVGMWLGLSGRKANRATIIAMIRIMVLPTVAFTVISTIVAIVSPNTNSGPVTVGLFWIALSTVTNVAFMQSASRHLRHFRALVAQRFTKGDDDTKGAGEVRRPKTAVAK
jgi:ABC-type transport system involved in multi-copper enzyme maturation permease subunit